MFWRCCRKALRRSAAAMAHTSIAIASTRLRARRGARMTAITSGGAIPETALFTVVSMPEGTMSAPWMKICGRVAGRRHVVAGQHLMANSAPREQDRAHAGGRCARLSRRIFLSGAVKRRRVPQSCRLWLAIFDSGSATCCRTCRRLSIVTKQSRGGENRRMAEVRNAGSTTPVQCRCSTYLERTRRAGLRAYTEDSHRRALLRRGRRNAIGDSCAFRRARQQGVGTGAPQAFLQQLQF